MPLESKWIPRYFDLFHKHLDGITQREGQLRYEYRQLQQTLKSVHCKRMMFDAKQAAVFDAAEPIKLEGTKIHPPFGCFWMELTEPIYTDSQQPGFQDELVAIHFISNCFKKVPVLTPSGKEHLDLSQVVFIFHNPKTEQWIDRSFCASLDTKKAFTTQKIVDGSIKWKERLPTWFEHQGHDPLENVVADHIDRVFGHSAEETFTNTGWAEDIGLFEAGMVITGKEQREVSWWESCIQDHTDQLLWILAYCMAKSIKIEEMRMPRQQRRALERQGKVPTPWHRVFVEPRLIYKTLPGETDTGRTVGHRFDVIGHLRFSKHKIKDGSYRHTVEWVPDHQRGLEHELYIPKTYAVAKTSKTVPENKTYFGDEAKNL